MKRRLTTHYFMCRWRGEIPLRTLLWRDLLMAGTAINTAFTFTALIAAAQGASSAVIAALHFAPLPYNLFLFAAVARAPARMPWVMGAATVWLIVMTVV